MNETKTYPGTQKSAAIYSTGEKLRPTNDMIEYYRQYARERPEVVALWCFGIGFVLGWKLKPW